MGCAGSKDGPEGGGAAAPQQQATQLTSGSPPEPVASQQVKVDVPLEAPQAAAASKKQEVRRKGVSAEAGGASKTEYKKVVHEKTAEQKEMIAKSTAESSLFLGLSDEQRAEVVDACVYPTDQNPGSGLTLDLPWTYRPPGAACLRACVPACLPACLLACVPTAFTLLPIHTA